MRILICEDTKDIRELLRSALETRYDCDVAVDGAEAIAAYDRAIADGEPYRLVLLDASMPIATGYDVARHIRSNHADVESKLLMITAYPEFPSKEHAADVGVDLFMAKPIDFAALLTLAEMISAPQHLVPFRDST